MEDNVRSALAQHLADAEARELPALTARDARLAGLRGKVDAVIGMRRVGKSSLLLAKMHELIAAGVPRARLLHVDFEDERLVGMRAEHLQLIEEVFYQRHPESHAHPCWYFFDEIHNVPGWERYVRRLLADPRLQIALTGSSARLLSSEIATSMRGRSLDTELWPFSFAEAIRHRGVDEPTRWPAAPHDESRLRSEFDRYLQVGGFPELQGVSQHLRRPILLNYLDVAILRDVIERHAVRNAPLLRAVVRRLVRSMACRVSVHALAKDLKSQGHEFGKNQIYELIGHVEDAFLVRMLEVEAHSEKRRQVNPRKVYVVDHALARAVSGQPERDVGQSLENIVYLELRRRGEVLGYHMSASGREVDFVAADRNGRRSLVQVCATIDDDATRQRELDAFADAIAETGIDRCELITLAHAGTETANGHPVRVVPAWRWLLTRTTD